MGQASNKSTPKGPNSENKLKAAKNRHRKYRLRFFDTVPAVTFMKNYIDNAGTFRTRKDAMCAARDLQFRMTERYKAGLQLYEPLTLRNGFSYNGGLLVIVDAVTNQIVMP